MDIGLNLVSNMNFNNLNLSLKLLLYKIKIDTLPSCCEDQVG